MTAFSEKACQKRLVKDEEALTFAAGQSGVRIYNLLIDGEEALTFVVGLSGVRIYNLLIDGEEAFTFVAGESGEGLLLPLQGEFTLCPKTQGAALGEEGL